jgi:hypothetical protein
MDELVLGLAVGTIVALCLALILRTVGKSRQRAMRTPKSKKMTARERRTIAVALLLMAIVLLVGIGMFFFL